MHSQPRWAAHRINYLLSLRLETLKINAKRPLACDVTRSKSALIGVKKRPHCMGSNKIMLIRIRLPPKVPCHMYNLSRYPAYFCLPERW